MKLLLFLLGTLYFSLSSCEQKADQEKAKQFATTIHTNTTGEIKEVQQAFVNEMTEALKKYLNSDIAKVDTKHLRESLDKAKDANRKSFVAISKIEEVDNVINLRKKTLAENEIYRALYEKDFSLLLNAMESNEPKKATKVKELAISFSDKEKETRQIQNTAQEAVSEFSKKYNIIFHPDSQK